MNRDQKRLTDYLLAELDSVKLGEPAPMRADYRLALAEMVLTEIPGDTPEQIAWRADAQALHDWCWDPTNPATIAQYRAAINNHADLLRATFRGYADRKSDALKLNIRPADIPANPP